MPANKYKFVDDHMRWFDIILNELEKHGYQTDIRQILNKDNDYFETNYGRDKSKTQIKNAIDQAVRHNIVERPAKNKIRLIGKH